jgi:hypothetical protein
LTFLPLVRIEGINQLGLAPGGNVESMSADNVLTAAGQLHTGADAGLGRPSGGSIGLMRSTPGKAARSRASVQQLLLEAMRLEKCAVFTVKYGLTIKMAAAYWVISSEPIAR